MRAQRVSRTVMDDLFANLPTGFCVVMRVAELPANEPIGPRVPVPQRPTVPALRAWLEGDGTGRYSAGVARALDGRVLSASIGDIARGVPEFKKLYGPGGRSIATAIGRELALLGWTSRRVKRYGGRETRWHRPWHVADPRA